MNIAYYHIRFCFFPSALCLNFHTKPHLFLQLYLIVERHLYRILYIVYTTMKITKSGTVCQTSSSYTERCMFAASEITKVSKSCQPCNDRYSSCKSDIQHMLDCMPISSGKTTPEHTRACAHIEVTGVQVKK